jgi:hypothetical protein
LLLHGSATFLSLQLNWPNCECDICNVCAIASTLAASR